MKVQDIRTKKENKGDLLVQYYKKCKKYDRILHVLLHLFIVFLLFMIGILAFDKNSQKDINSLIYYAIISAAVLIFFIIAAIYLLFKTISHKNKVSQIIVDDIKDIYSKYFKPQNFCIEGYYDTYTITLFYNDIKNYASFDLFKADFCNYVDSINEIININLKCNIRIILI